MGKQKQVFLTKNKFDVNFPKVKKHFGTDDLMLK